MATREQNVAIAVIGVTGSGKSTFINIAGGSNLPVGKSLRSCTTKLESSTFFLDGCTVTLIDTPGFDDTTQNVLHVLKLISDSFSGLHSQGVKLAGVIYMHCIDMGGPSRHNFHTFCKFCDETSLRDVLIVTNKWPGEGPSCGEAREHESANNDEFFRPAIDKGARMLHHDGSQASARAILRHLINRQPTTPPVQGDSSDRKTNLAHTTARTDAIRELTGQVEHHAKAFEGLLQEISVATLAEDKETRETLQEMAKESLEKIERIRHDLEHMVTNFATENSRLEDENRRYKKDSLAHKVESELRTRLLGEERKARELTEAERGRAEMQLTEERASSQRQKMERDVRDYTGPKYDKFLVCGALMFALISVSRFVFDGSTSLL